MSNFPGGDWWWLISALIIDCVINNFLCGYVFRGFMDIDSRYAITVTS